MSSSKKNLIHFAVMTVIALAATVVHAVGLADEASAATTLCRDADMAGTPVRPDVDCTEYNAQLDQQAKRVQKMADIQKTLAQIKEPTQPKPVAGPSALGSLSGTPAPPTPPISQLPGIQGMPTVKATDDSAASDRLLEVFGGNARIRWGGHDRQVKVGSVLPGGAKVSVIKVDGVGITAKDGKSTKWLPYYVGN